MRLSSVAAHPVQPAVKSQQLSSRQGVMEAEVLREKPDPGPHSALSQGRAEHTAAPTGRSHEPQQQLQGGRLARAVRPQESEYLPRATESDRSATATVAPNCLRRPLVSIAR